MKLPQDSDLIERVQLLNEQGRSHALKKELNAWKMYGGLTLIGVGIFVLKFSGNEIKVSHDKSDVVIHSWSWWGFSRTETPIVWRGNQWMAKDDKGEWRVAVVEPEYDPPESPR